MGKEKEVEVGVEINKARARIDINLALLSVCFLIFIFIASTNPKLLENRFVSLQLTLAIPFLISSLFARSKNIYSSNKKFDKFGFIMFTIAYSFLINIVGILLAGFTSVYIGLIFFIVNILCAITYSIIEVSENKAKLKSRFVKDLFFILLVVLFGILPSLGVF